MKKSIIYFICIVIIIIFVVIVINSGVFNSEKEITINKKSESVDNEIVLSNIDNYSYSIDISDRKVRNENSEFIIIGTVDSIDGAINYNEKEKIYTIIQTIGKVKVNKILKGSIEEGIIIPIIRIGGVISFEEYEKGLDESQKNKNDLVKSLSSEEKKNKFVSELSENNIQIEQGKTYLMYLKYNSDYERYGIIFQEYGLNEVENIEFLNDIDNLYIINNITKKSEKISDYIGNV